MASHTNDSRVARLDAIRAAESLAELARVMGVDDEHEAYLRGREEWEALRAGTEPARDPDNGVPGDCVVVDGHAFHVHGVTHAGTAAEREFLRVAADAWLDAGATIYTEQGIRPLYFEGLDVCEMDDYRWAMARCRELDGDSHVTDVFNEERHDALPEPVEDLSDRFREVAFSLIDRGDGVYGDRFRDALGDVASSLLTSHADLATGTDFEAFRLRETAAKSPARLAELQRYYERTFLPQPLEREWLRRHDPELELVTHARNARMADYAVYHNESATEVHLVVGAAHQPGVVYYLDRHRTGDRSLNGFAPV